MEQMIKGQYYHWKDSESYVMVFSKKEAYKIWGNWYNLDKKRIVRDCYGSIEGASVRLATQEEIEIFNKAYGIEVKHYSIF